MIEIGKDTFDVPPPKGMRSFALQQRILPVVGRVAEVILHFVGATGAKVDSMADLLGSDVMKVLPLAMPAIGNIFASMPAGELETITRELLGEASLRRGKVTMKLFGASAGDPFDQIMQGRSLDTWKLLWYALEVWYPDFFEIAAGLKGGAQKESPSEESSTSPLSGQDGA
jgi:hypothetical protein